MTLLNPESTATPSLTPELTKEQAAQQEQEETNAKVAGASAILAFGSIASRVLGLIRETSLSYLFGPSPQVSAFLVATFVPSAINDLLIGGHVNGALIPVLSEIVTVKGREELWRIVSILMSLLTVALALIVLVMEIFAPQIIMLTISDTENSQTLAAGALHLLTVDLLRITAPALIFMGLFAIFSATLYALKSFTLPAFAGMVWNGTIVLIALALIATPGRELAFNPTFSVMHPLILVRPHNTIIFIAAAWLLGGVLQMVLLLFGLKLSRLRFVLDWRHPALRTIAKLYAPVMLSLIIDTLIIRPVSYNLASQTGSGSIAYMNWATLLLQFPQGLVATAISIAILPTLARQALGTDQNRAFKDTLGLGLRLTICLIIPAAVGLFVLSHPIVALLFQRGEFKAVDTEITSLALRLYLLGLPFAALDLLLVYAFYARKDTTTPAIIGVVSFIMYMVVALSLMPRYGLFSLMLADTTKHITHAVISGIILRARIKGFARQHLIATALKAITAAIAMGIIGTLLLPPLTRLIGANGGGFVREAIVVTIVSGICAAAYIVLALIFNIEELHWLMGQVVQRISRIGRWFSSIRFRSGQKKKD